MTGGGSAPASAAGTGDAGGLSTGAKIGIGVGVGLIGVLVLGGIAIFVYRRGKTAGRKEGPQEMDGMGAGYDDEAKPKLAPEAEQPVYELRGSWRGAELEGQHHRVLAELSAEPRNQIESSADVYPGGR